jgi:predicted acetyltransferase
MTQLHYSAQESANTGLRIARCGRLKSISARDIWSEIETEAYDLVKIKAELSAPDIFSEIERFPCFSMPFNIIALQKKTPEFIPFTAENELLFELYDGTQKEEVKEIISDIQGKDTNLYYDSDIYQALISTDQQQSTSMEYYLSMNNSLDASRYLFIGRNLEGVGVGICSFMQTNETDAEGVIYGVRPKFRSRQYAAIFLQQSLNTLAEAGTQNFFTEVQYYNFRSLYPHINQGFKPAGLYVNLNLFPLQTHYLESFTCSGKHVKVAVADWLSQYLHTGLSTEWKSTKGAVGALFSDDLIEVKVLVCNKEFSVFSFQKPGSICYAQIHHQSGLPELSLKVQSLK